MTLCIKHPLFKLPCCFCGLDGRRLSQEVILGSKQEGGEGRKRHYGMG